MQNFKIISFEGEHLINKEIDDKVENLSANYDIYIKTRDLKKLTAKANSSTALARGAMRFIFTESAREKCSVSGKPAPGKAGGKEVRTALHPEGVDAIIDFVKSRSAKKKWPCPQESTLKQAMANVLCEDIAKVADQA